MRKRRTRQRSKRVLSLLLSLTVIASGLVQPVYAVQNVNAEEVNKDSVIESTLPDETSTNDGATLLEEKVVPDAALDNATKGIYEVYLHATVKNLEIKQNGTVIKADSVTEKDGYTVYAMKLAAGNYEFSAAGYGNGNFKVTGNDNLYLREVRYQLQEKPPVGYKIRVVNMSENTLVYTSDETVGAVAKLLVPAYGYKVRYQYNFEPVSSEYCAFYGNLWVKKGTAPFDGFKTSSFNLSDSRVYLMSTGYEVTFKIPTGAHLKVEELVKFYRQNNQYKTTFVSSDGKYDTYTAFVPNRGGGELYYVVSMDGHKKVANTIKSGETKITVDALDRNPGMHEDKFEANIISNGNASKFISLQTGDCFDLWTSRAWQAINSGTANGYLEPDKHYHVIEGDSVTIDEYGVVHAKKSGLSIVAITYDAMDWCGKTYGAIREDCVGVFAFMVDGNRQGITSGLEGLSDFHTFYFAKSVTVDGSDKIEKNDYMEYTIKPSSTNGQPISVSSLNVKGYPTPKASGWQKYVANSDGSYTIKLYEGRNVVKVEAGGASQCYVLHAAASDIKVKNLTNPGKAIVMGDKIEVSYTNVITPQPKLGAIYNPGYGGTVYLEGAILDSTGSEVAKAKGDGVQYGIAKKSNVKATVPAAGKVTVSGVRIHSGAFGSAPSAHLALGLQSEGGNYSGEDAPESSSYWSFFQDIKIDVLSSDASTLANDIIALINKIGTVKYTPECKKLIDDARKAYDKADDRVQKLVLNYDVLIKAEADYEKLVAEETGKNIKKRTISGKTYYVITNADELLWFSKLVNGMLTTPSKRVENANAVLENDIVFNENILDKNGQPIGPSGQRHWIPIGGNKVKVGTRLQTTQYKGIFDGQGHTIRGIYVNGVKNASDIGFIGKASGAQIKNLKLKDSCIIGSTNYVGGIAGYLSGRSVVENVSYDGYVGGANNIGGIIGMCFKNLNDCKFTGNVECTSTGGCAGGIIGHSGYGEITLKKCVVDKGTTVKSNGYAGGIVGNACNGTIIIETCYVVGKIAGKTGAAGIVVADTKTVDSVVNNCFAYANVTGPEAQPVAAPEFKKVGTSCGLLYSGAAESKDITLLTQEEFKNGKAAYLLGKNYGQTLTGANADEHPVFNNGKNQIFYVNGKYASASVEAAENLIGAIGKVGLGGEGNCFARVETARQCFDILSKADQNLVKNKRMLLDAEKAYDDVVATVVKNIADIGNVTINSKLKIDKARNDYDAYISHAGDASRVSNYSTLTDAEEKYKLCLIDAEEQKIEKTIKTKEVNGQKFYLVENTQQMDWIAKLINGELAIKAKDDKANVMLANDIVINADLVSSVTGANGEITIDVLKKKNPWRMIKNHKGIFDGNGHCIYGVAICEENGEAAMFDAIDGTIRNLIVKDSVILGKNAFGISRTMQSGVMDRCGFEGVIKGKFYAGGLTGNLYAGGKISNSYSIGPKLVEGNDNQSYRNGGIITHLNGGVVENCYSSGEIKNGNFIGGIAAMIDSTAKIKNCYYAQQENLPVYGIANRDNCEVIGGGVFDNLKLSNGYVAYMLGDEFGQNIGVDTHPVHSNGKNKVYFANGSYVNGSVATAEALINAIGTVSLIGSENCFANVETAEKCFNALSQEEKGKVKNRAILEAAQKQYVAVVETLERDIKSVTPLSVETLTKYETLSKDIDAYTKRGGDTKRISNYDAYVAAQKAYPDVRLTATEASIKHKIEAGRIIYIIENADQLEWFGHLVNGTLPTGTKQNRTACGLLKNDIKVNDKLIENLGCSEKNGFVVDKDYARKAKTITLIGKNKDNSYQGIFDGNNHTISGLYTTENGLFGNVEGTIKNLSLRDSVLNSEQSECGGIAGTVLATGKIENCSFDGILISDQSLGGIVGKNMGSIRYCHTNMKLVPKVDYGLAYAGGIVGSIRDTGVVEYSYSHGTIYCDMGKSVAHTVGGIAGDCVTGTKVENCYSAMKIINGKRDVGGIIGEYNNGTLKNNYCDSNVKALGTYDGTGENKNEQAEQRPAKEFSDGTILKLLGAPYVQNLANEKHPILPGGVTVEKLDEILLLAPIKDAAVKEIEGYKNASDYRDAQKEELAAAIEAARKAIDASESKEAVDKAVADAKIAMDKIKTAAQLDKEEADAAAILAKAKAEAKKEIEGYKNASDYRDAQKEELEATIDASKKAIDASESKEAVDKAVADAKVAMDKIKTDAQLDKEEAEAAAAALAKAKAEAKKEIEGYKNASDYRDAEKEELAAAIDASKKAIDASESKEAVDKAVADAKVAMDKIKTDAQLDKEEAEAADNKKPENTEADSNDVATGDHAEVLIYVTLIAVAALIMILKRKKNKA